MENLAQSNHRCLIVAEIGICHNGDLSLAKTLIDEAVDAGCEIAKFQAYKPERLWPDHKLMIGNKNWYDQVAKTELSFSQLKELAKYCELMNIEFLCSVFDNDRVSWLEKIGVKRHKVGNRYKDPAVIEAMAKTGKEVWMSHTPSEPFEVPANAYTQFRRIYCVSKYPTLLQDLHLGSIEFGCEWDQYWGASLHCPSIEPAMIAIARGARMVEVHFTFNRRDQSGPDHCCSIEYKELKELVKFRDLAEEALS